MDAGKQLKILVFAGSTRSGSFNKKLARIAAAELAAGAAVTLVDLKDYPMPLYDGDAEAATGLPERAAALKRMVREHDAIVIASPEYNGSFPALVKNVIDWISRAEAGEPPLAVLRGKAAALLSTSPGGGGGQRGLRHLKELLEMIGVRVIPAQLTIAGASHAFGEQGELVRAEDRERISRWAAEVLAALQAGVSVVA